MWVFDLQTKIQGLLVHFQKDSCAVDFPLTCVSEFMGQYSRYQEALLSLERKFDRHSFFENRIFFSESMLHWSFGNTEGIKTLDEHSLPALTIHSAVIHAFYEHRDLLNAALSDPSCDRRVALTPIAMIIGWEESLDFILKTILPQEILEAGRKERHPMSSLNKNGFALHLSGGFVPVGFTIGLVQSIIAYSLHLILDELEGSKEDPLWILQKCLKESISNFSPEEIIDAKMEFNPKHYPSFLSAKTLRCFETVLNEEELAQCMNFYHEQYVDWMRREIEGLLEEFREKKVSERINEAFGEPKIANVEDANRAANELEKILLQNRDLKAEIQAKVFFELAMPWGIKLALFNKNR